MITKAVMKIAISCARPAVVRCGGGGSEKIIVGLLANNRLLLLLTPVPISFPTLCTFRYMVNSVYDADKSASTGLIVAGNADHLQSAVY